MMTTFKDFDFARAESALRATVDRDAGRGVDYDTTELLRTLTGADDALFTTHSRSHTALSCPREDGGLELTDDWTLEHPLLRVIARLASHPALWGGMKLEHPDPFETRIAEVCQPGLLPWSARAAIDDVIAGFRTYFGDYDIPADRPIQQIMITNAVMDWRTVLESLITFDEYGAFDPTFTRQDALAGDLWLLQPVSPRLDHRRLAWQVGLEMLGFLPPSAVDVPGRVIMACIDRVPMPADRRLEQIADNKWFAGVTRTRWQRRRPPLDNPTFDLLNRIEVPAADGYGAYAHSSELPRWG